MDRSFLWGSLGLVATALGLSGCGGDGDSTPADPTMAQTQQGAVKGTAAANGVVQFLGIPYAAAPTGALRWKPPAAAPARTAMLEASAPGSQCLQAGPPPTFTATGSEDCLFLNVYRPDAAPAAPLPVVVVIHGGGFVLGSSAFITGTSLARNHNVIVVTINY